MFRLDYNVGNIGAGFHTVRDGFVENNYWRYYEALYGIFARLRERFPNVIFENCASGGGRSELGMVRHFSHTWVTDWQIAPRSFWITNGMTMALPPELADRLLGMGQSGHTRAALDFQTRLVLFVHPTIAWFNLEGSRPNPLQAERISHALQLYKEFVRPFHRESRIFHHTPTPESAPGWGVLELAARDGSRVMIGLFRLDGAGTPEYVLRPRGVDRARRYRVVSDNSGQAAVVDGFALASQGVHVRLEGALTSELFLYEAVG